MERGLAEQLVFPLELELGLTQGATPALAELIAGMMAEAGASQGRVLAALKERHHEHMGAERLRKIVATLAEELASFGRGALVARLVAAVEDVARQGARPVLSVGRDGITLRQYRQRWTKQGARQILVLRTHLLSRILDKTFLAALSERPLPKGDLASSEFP